MRAFFAIPITLLAILALAPRPAAASAITYDFSGTLAHGPSGDPSNTSVTGQFTIDFDTQSITAFHFLTPVIEIDSSQWTPVLRTYTPAYSPATDFVSVSFGAGPISALTLLFQTTLASFDGSTFYPHFILSTSSQATGSGLVCQESAWTSCVGFFGAPFVSGAATPHTDPPPTVPEPASLALLGSGLAMFAARRRQRVPKGLTARAAVRATAALMVLALCTLAPRPAAAAPMTYDFSATLDHGPVGDPGNTAVTGQFAIDADTATITAFDFLTLGGGEVDASHGYITYLFTYTPAVSPADNFVQLVFENGDSGGTLVLLFRTTLAAFNGNTFYTGLVEIDGGGTGSGFECQYVGCGPRFGSPFVSGAATPHTTPPPNDPPATVPEPASLTLIGSGLVILAGRLRRRTPR